MGLFDFLFSSKKTKKVGQHAINHPQAEQLTFLGGCAEIKSLSFIGQFDKSHSGEWIICWSDSDPLNNRGGFRDSGNGSYALYNAKQNKIVLHGLLERPNGGSVADNGTFALEDWHFGSGLTGTLYVISADGRQLINRKFEANLYSSAISDNGRYAMCQTANSPSENDSFRLTAFDVEKSIQLFSVSPSTGLTQKYKFNEETPKFGVVIKSIGTFYYDVNGNLIDPAKFVTARLRSNSYKDVLYAAEEILKSPDLNDKRGTEALEAATRALSLGAENDQGWKAIALKLQGIAHEFLGNNEAAITAYDAALLINPKIGVKRKADMLRKKMGK